MAENDRRNQGYRGGGGRKRRYRGERRDLNLLLR
jgi:hypothetical protein